MFLFSKRATLLLVNRLTEIHCSPKQTTIEETGNRKALAPTRKTLLSVLQQTPTTRQEPIGLSEKKVHREASYKTSSKQLLAQHHQRDTTLQTINYSGVAIT